MKFTKVFTGDWYGKRSLFDILHLTNHRNGFYSCIFRNSSGDYEKKLVNEQDLYQG